MQLLPLASTVFSAPSVLAVEIEVLLLRQQTRYPSPALQFGRPGNFQDDEDRRMEWFGRMAFSS